MVLELAPAAFLAGVLTFLAPCTLPLVPAYLAFISGVSLGDLQTSRRNDARRAIFVNGLLYVIGFSVVFILLGLAASVGGFLLSPYRMAFEKIGAVCIFLFGLFMTGMLKVSFLQVNRTLAATNIFRPGNPVSSFLFGATFAFGWTPCVGPVLGSVLVLAAITDTASQGAFLLGVFSLGLAIPFMIIASAAGWASKYIDSVAAVTKSISLIGGIFLMFIGVLVFFGKLGLFTTFFFGAFGFLDFQERLLDYL